MYTLLTLLIISITQFLFFKDIKEFSLSKKELLGIVFIFTPLVILVNPLNLHQSMTLVTIFLLFDLAVVDVKYLEVNPKVYKYLIVTSIITLISSPLLEVFYLNIISFLIMFFIFFFADKVKSIESLGGADIKIMLILSINFTIFEIFSFIFYALLFNILIFVLLAIKNRRFNKIEVPMIISIMVSFFGNMYLTYFL